jgi:hypothetical protein
MIPKCLGQVVSVAITEGLLYVTPNSVSSTLTTIVVCNRDAAISVFRISLNLDKGATSDKDYLYYDVSISGNNTFIAELNLPLTIGNQIRVYSDTNNLTFSVYGKEEKT